MNLTKVRGSVFVEFVAEKGSSWQSAARSKRMTCVLRIFSHNPSPRVWTSMRCQLAVAYCVWTALAFVVAMLPLRAQTMSEALTRAYVANPQLNAQRANTRAVDENLPGALANYRPTLNGEADAGILQQNFHIPGTVQFGPNGLSSSTPGSNLDTFTEPRTAALTLSQNLFNGFRTENAVNQANSQILGSREALRNTEITVLGNSAIAYMNLLRDTAVYALRQNNVAVLEQQLSDTRERLAGGEVTRTDLSQAEAAVAQGRADRAAAQTNLRTSIANYRQWIGVEPKKLAPARALGNLLPKSLNSATQIAEAENPLVRGAIENAEAAESAVRIAMGQLAPTVNLVGSVTQQWDFFGTRQRLFDGLVSARLTMPFYEGGAISTQVRQAKEKLAEARLVVDQQRDQVRASVGSSWAIWENARTVIEAARDQVRAAEAALEGVREEARLGQRTTQDILNAQLFLLNARVLLVTAQRDQVVASYSVLASIGHLSAQVLGLNFPAYDPTIHYDQVKHKWLDLDLDTP
jgi:outer membrane protein